VKLYYTLSPFEGVNLNFMIWDEDMKELETRLSHQDNISEEYRLQINLEKAVMLQFLRIETCTGEKISGKEIKVDKFIHFGRMKEKMQR
jgi:hypothetical protein